MRIAEFSCVNPPIKIESFPKNPNSAAFRRCRMSNNLPSGLSPTYWRKWNPPRTGASVSESLEAGEEWIGGWDGVGLYEGYLSDLPILLRSE